MIEGTNIGRGELPIPNEYLHDGHIRRSLHEFGATGLKFYSLAHKRMGYRPGDIVAEVGAGMGDDGKEIAWNYRPRVVFLVEPASEDIDTRYLPLSDDLSGKEVHGVEVLNSSMLETTVSEMNNPDSPLLRGRTTYIQPVKATAERLDFLPDNSVNKYSSIHSIYEFANPFEAMRQAVRVMTADAKGIVVTNGPEDKLVFKDIILDAANWLDKLSPGDAQYIAPPTVSSRLDYNQAFDLLSQFYEDVKLVTYRDRMIITPERAPFYIWSFNSYRRYFSPSLGIDRSWLWREARKKALLERLEREIEARGCLEDQIDIAAIYFSGPKK